jgi:hypothetical protein
MRTTICALVLLLVATTAAAAEPETVMITYRPTTGSEAKLRQVIADHWSAVTRLGLVNTSPHLVVRYGSTLVEIFTWKDAATPDNAPPEIAKIWGEMAKLTEKKNGISIDQVEVVTP